ncbi:MAG: sulfite exporter TauE/SafE family protein [Myxococcota bacterium]
MFEIDVISAIALTAAGVAAGFVNTLAGGGMMITLPVMVFIGLPETLANGTSRFGILFQASSSAWAYYKKGVLNLERIKLVVPPVLVGAIVGAFAGANLPDHVFRFLFGGVMVVFAALLLKKPSKTDGEVSSTLSPRFYSPWARWLILVPVGLYGGMIQAGMGYVVLGALTLGFRFTLMEANILKVALIGAYTPVVVAIFLGHGELNILVGALLAVGQATGAWFGAHLALERGVGLVRAMLLTVIVISSMQLFGVWAWLFGLAG